MAVQMMTKTLILAMVITFLLAVLVGGQTNECQSEEDAGTNCTITTGILSSGICSSFTYDLSNVSHLIIDDGELTATQQPGRYETTFNQSIPGWYMITPCDNSTSTITVRATRHDKLDSILVNLTEVDTAIISVNTTVQDLNTTITAHLSSIETLINALNDLSAADIWTYVTRTLTSLVLGSESSPDTFRQNVSIAVWNLTDATPLQREVNAINDTGAGSAADVSQNVSEILTKVIEINTTTHAIEDNVI